jgi:hypothetical protein
MDELAAGIIGVCHQQNIARQDVGDGKQQYRQLFEQGSGIAVGEDQPFLNQLRQWYGGHMSGSALDQHRNGLKRESSPGELCSEALAEPSVRLSPHSAPIR